MGTARDVAKWFLSKESMSHKKLQKLCYYAQAWHCTLLNGATLFEDDIQAWVHGPVVASLYPVYADYRWVDIPKIDFDESVFSAKSLEVLGAVYDTFSQFTGDQLESMTHKEDPWIEARGDLKPWEVCTNVISIESMRKYYGKLYAQTQND